MRRVLLALISTVTGLVMLLSFKTHAVVATAVVATPPPATSTALPTTPATTSATIAPAKTVTGDAVDTRWGPVQVKITITNGKITSAVAVQYPSSNGRDQEINAYAVPALEQETLDASSASIDMVSGATFTSNGYITSLQSALDKV